MHWTLGRRIAGLLIAAVALAGPAAAEVNATYTLDFASAYVWRGITVTDGVVWQPQVTVAHGSGFALNVWGNWDWTDDNDLEHEFIEVDITPSYTFDTGSDLTAAVGLIEYIFPNSGAFDDATTEAWFSLGWNGTIVPTLAVYYDFDAVDDYYANLGIAYVGEVTTDTTFKVALTAGYAGEDFASFYAGGVDSGFFDGRATVTLAYAPADKWGISGYAAFSDTLDDDVLPEQEVDFFGGISFTRTF
jgi:uncharacterized protein (TIGR02001 family)